MIYTDGVHMITDGDLEELHNMALSMGMKRAWFQDKPNRPHYDLITMTKVKLALKSGAVPIASTDVVRILRGERFEPEPVSMPTLLHYRDSVPALNKWLKRFSRKRGADGSST